MHCENATDFRSLDPNQTCHTSLRPKTDKEGACVDFRVSPDMEFRSLSRIYNDVSVPEVPVAPWIQDLSPVISMESISVTIPPAEPAVKICRFETFVNANIRHGLITEMNEARRCLLFLTGGKTIVKY